MAIIEYTGPSNPQEIRKYLMRRTKDQIVWEYLRQWREYGTLEKERDALAAHLARLRGLGQLVRNAATDMANIGTEELFDRAEKWDAALEDSPTTSFARLKAEWCEQHAKRFMELADNARINGYAAHADGVDEMAQELKDEAAELRRQAQEVS